MIDIVVALEWMVFYHALNIQRLCDMAAVLDLLRQVRSPFPKLLQKAWKDFSKATMTDTLPVLPSKKKKGRREPPPCHETGGVCVHGENVIPDLWVRSNLLLLLVPSSHSLI